MLLKHDEVIKAEEKIEKNKKKDIKKIRFKSIVELKEKETKKREKKVDVQKGHFSSSSLIH